MATRYDSVDFEGLRKPVRSDEGFLEIHGRLTRTGVFKYRNADGTVRREWRPPETATTCREQFRAR